MIRITCIGYGNEHAEIVLTGDRKEFDQRHEELRYREFPVGGKTVFLAYAEDKLFADFKVDDPKMPAGYGGVSFSFPMADGSTTKVVGPWSGNSDSVNKCCGCDVIEAVFLEDGWGLSCAVNAKIVAGMLGLPDSAALRALLDRHDRRKMR